jgi:hypothetical protein
MLVFVKFLLFLILVLFLSSLYYEEGTDLQVNENIHWRENEGPREEL